MAYPPGQAVPSRPTTRSSTLVINDIIENSSEAITDAMSARKLLDTLQFCIPGEAMTLEHLSHTLFYISMRAATPTLHSLIWAAAFLMTELTVSPIISLIQKLVSREDTSSMDLPASSQKEDLKVITGKLDVAIDQWSTQQEEMKIMLSKVLQINDPTDLIIMDAWIQSISESIISIQTAIEAIKTQPPTIPSMQNHPPQSFRDILASEQHPTNPTPREVPLGFDQARGRSAIKQRQLLMDPNSDHLLIKPDTSIDELAKTFQKVLDSMQPESATPLELRSIFRLHNQGLVLEM